MLTSAEMMLTFRGKKETLPASARRVLCLVLGADSVGGFSQWQPVNLKDAIRVFQLKLPVVL
jgi:hypothetical protein